MHKYDSYILWRKLHISLSGRNNKVVNSQGDGMTNVRNCLRVLVEGKEGELLHVMVLLLWLLKKRPGSPETADVLCAGVLSGKTLL